jgi:hypothetical protein
MSSVSVAALVYICIGFGVVVADFATINGRLLIPSPSRARIHLNAGQYTAIPQGNSAFSL